MASTDQLLHQLGEVAAEVFFVYHLDSQKLKYVGKGFAKLGADLPGDALAHPEKLMDIVHPDDRKYLSDQWSIFNNHGQLEVEFRLINLHQQERYVQLTAYRLATEPLAVGWLRDVDVVKRNIFYAEEINARKNSLLEILSHDLKEPVGVISMMATAIKNDPAVSGNKTLEGYIKVIQDLCESNIKMIRSLVQEEFRQARDISLRIERVDLVGAVQNIMEHYHASAPIIKKEIVFESDVPQLFLLMDTLKMIQVVNNLISNAIKFTADGGRITVKISDRGSVARITISDDGVGIPLDLQPYLFQPRSRAQRPGIRGEAGSGMGLSIIHSLVTLHNGRIWLDTAETNGTVFHIELPKR